jgi:hypothetical protein
MIAGVEDARPGYGSANAILARTPITEEQSIRADQPIVMQRLDNRKSHPPASDVGRRRDQRKGVVKVHDLRSPPANDTVEPLDGTT